MENGRKSADGRTKTMPEFSPVECDEGPPRWFLQPGSATAVIVLASSFCVCLSVCLALMAERTDVHT